MDHDARRAGLRVPEAELGQVAPRRILEGEQPVVDRGRAAVVPPEIQPHRLQERLAPDEAGEDADQLGALLVDRRGVEVVDLDVAVGPHGMRQRAVVLAELARHEQQRLLDPAHRAAAHVADELLLAKDRQALLQRQLEPVAAGHPVAGPVVEVLVRDDPLDQLVVAVGRGLGADEHVAAVEDVQPLVLHRAHVEVVDRDDVEHVEVVFSP